MKVSDQHIIQNASTCLLSDQSRIDSGVAVMMCAMHIHAQHGTDWGFTLTTKLRYLLQNHNVYL